eukprot:12163248-Alexandrium_andersonii.AAC.1
MVQCSQGDPRMLSACCEGVERGGFPPLPDERGHQCHGARMLGWGARRHRVGVVSGVQRIQRRRRQGRGRTYQLCPADACATVGCDVRCVGRGSRVSDHP